MSYLDVEARLRTALITLILDEYSLLQSVRLPVPASQRVIATQLAWRLRTEYERSWDVDVEYNRIGHGYKPGTRPDAPDPAARPVDISIHHRGLTGPAANLLVIELKTHGVDDLAAELAQLNATKVGFKYRHAALLDLGMREGDDPNGPPVVLEPAWLWLPGGRDMSPVFDGDQAKQLSREGWQAHELRVATRKALEQAS
ncbi:MAG: hypothetical protein FWD29_02445 [Micrococcales bacterium]|nr:hypothetical protein [Micrococcales bacterium]